MDAWLNAANIEKDLLSTEDYLELDFIFSGLASILGNHTVVIYQSNRKF